MRRLVPSLGMFMNEVLKQAKVIHSYMENAPGWEFTDSLQEALLAFCIAKQKWDPSRSKFRTFFINQATYRRKTLQSQEWKRYLAGRVLVTNYKRDMERNDGSSCQFLIEVKALLSQAPQDVRLVAKAVFAPQDFLDFMTARGHKKPTFRLLGKYLQLPKHRLMRAVNWLRREVKPSK